MTRFLLPAAVLSVVVAAATAAFTGRDAGDATTLTVTGSSTIAPVMADLGRAWEARNPGVHVNVQTGGSSRGIADVRRGLADLGMVSRGLAPEEADLWHRVIAHDGVAVIVHADNPVDGLTTEQVRGIWTGRITDWAEVGGGPGPITVVHKADGRATRRVFLDHFGIAGPDVAADVIVGDNEQGIKTVAGNPDAAGYVSIGTARADIEAGVAVRLPTLDGIQADADAVRTGRWPLVRRLNIVAPEAPTGAAAAFLEFVGSPEGAAVIERHRFVPAAAE